jgi:hypothetical protein
LGEDDGSGNQGRASGADSEAVRDRIESAWSDHKIEKQFCLNY